MKKILFSALVMTPLMTGGAHAACGDITLALFSFQSHAVNAAVDKFILNAGYGCNATLVTGDTISTLTSIIEKGEPDIASAVAPSLVGELYTEGVAAGRIGQIGTAIRDGTFSGWYIPEYVADAHPEIKTIDDALKRPELFPSQDDASKGRLFQGAPGWGDTVVTEQLFKAFEAEDKGFVLVPTGSAAALDAAIARAYERKEGFMAFYWEPTSLLARYPMVRLEGPAHDEAEWARCTTIQDCPDPKPNYWKTTEEITVAAGEFIEREDLADLKEYFANRSWTRAEVSKIMLWMTDNQANAEEGAEWFLKNMPEVWTKWVSSDVADKIKAAL